MTRDSDGGSRVLSNAVIEAVAEREDVAPTDLTPLYDVVNPDSLDTIFARESGGENDRVVFSYLGYEVTAYRSGRVELREVDE